jgi:hypothetical protein
MRLCYQLENPLCRLDHQRRRRVVGEKTAPEVPTPEKSRVSYVRLRAMQENIHGDPQVLRNRAKEISSRLKTNNAETLKMIAELDRAHKELAGFSEETTQHSDKFAAEWDALLRVPKVLDVICTDSSLIVRTDTVYAQHSKHKTWHRLGKFKIVITVRGTINFRNTAPLTNGLQAPHVFQDGHACWGNMRNVVNDLLKKREYAALVQVLLVFLSSVNVNDDIGRHLVDWPEVTEEEATGKKTPVKTKKRHAAVR